jgi:hypothetical protein
MQAEAQLKAARLAFLPSLTVGAEGQLSDTKGQPTQKTYNLPVTMQWEVDLSGRLRGEKRAALASYWSTAETERAVRLQLIAAVATTGRKQKRWLLAALRREAEGQSPKDDVYSKVTSKTSFAFCTHLGFVPYACIFSSSFVNCCYFMGAGRWFLRKNVYFCEQIIIKRSVSMTEGIHLKTSMMGQMKYRL